MQQAKPLKMNNSYTVIVVGAGPVGLLTALKLGRKGISTLVVEKHSGILDAARAIAYGLPPLLLFAVPTSDRVR